MIGSWPLPKSPARGRNHGATGKEREGHSLRDISLASFQSLLQPSPAQVEVVRAKGQDNPSADKQLPFSTHCVLPLPYTAPAATNL